MQDRSESGPELAMDKLALLEVVVWIRKADRQALSPCWGGPGRETGDKLLMDWRIWYNVCLRQISNPFCMGGSSMQGGWHASAEAVRSPVSL